MDSSVFWATTFQAAALFASTGLSIWAALITRTRRGVPGGEAFGWLMVATALWSFTSALHTLVDDYSARLIITKIQYLGVAPIGVLWLLFTTEYSRVAWPGGAILRVAVWIVPVTTLLLALTNEAHHVYWTSIEEITTVAGPRLRYRGGPWYWVHASYSYLLILIGTAILAQGLRRFPPLYRRQTALIIAGALVPWLGNFLYLSGIVAGLDLTPVAFTVSGACLTWGIYRHRLFGLLPVARDMVIDSMDDGVLVLDAQRRIVDMNAAAQRYTGCTTAFLGRPIDEAVPWWTLAIDEDRPKAERQPAIVKLEPGPRYFEVKVSAVSDAQQRFAGWLVIIHDVSNRRRSEAERYAFERRMQEQQKNESLMVLAGGVAHDFNNLLTGILGNADLLSILSPPDSDQRRAADAIVIGAQRAADLVSKMLAYSGGGRVVPETVDLDVLVRDMVDLLGASVARHCRLIYNSPGPLPLVETDPTQIRQVVLNLIVNAAEAVDDAGVITVATGEETLDAAALKKMTFGNQVNEGRYVFIDVVDNGTGMSEHTLARMFDPFFSTKDTGRGLGMAAVAGIVRGHRAALRVTSAEGQGTRFRIWFPVDVSIHSTRPASDVTRGQSTAP
ncbi:MAG TPA: histidine kinase N-terminal 7TM domain-containing protein [Vicinamibacterales bacterium]|nr:histidine kinase N-terminal 7TM domain-containing protein [Vicinamibacterales bacterium]